MVLYRPFCQQCHISAEFQFVRGIGIKEDKGTMSIAKSHFTIFRYFGWLLSFRRVCDRDYHYPACRLDIRQDSEFATGSGYPKSTFKWEPGTDPKIPNAFIDFSKIQAFGKSCTLRNHSCIIFRIIFSAFCAMTPNLSKL